MNEHEDYFDDEAIDLLGRLFEEFWVLREEEPEVYRLIRNREQQLKRYIHDKFGLELTVNQHFIRLEKIPVEPQSWMGIDSFQMQLDYAIFCCVLAYTEQKGLEEQFLLSDITEWIRENYPGEFSLDWTNYQDRRSLVRALSHVETLCLIKKIDGNLDGFMQDEAIEVLYEVTIYARYFMRSYPDDLFLFHTVDELLAQEWKRQSDGLRRKRVYRKLMMTPFVYRTGEDDLDFAYIRNYRNRLREDFEAHTPFRLEVFKNVAMLVLSDPKQRYTLFPDRKAICNVALHTMTLIRDEVENSEITELGTVRMPTARLDGLVRKAKEQYGHGWAKKHRDESPEATASQVTEFWKDWDMALLDEDARFVTIRPSVARFTAVYPADYEQERRVLV